jgi:membrane protein DedA with SNARE-associated domain
MDPIWIYFFIILITFVENVFPPIPGDVLLLFCGYLSGVGQTNWIALMVFAYIGSIVGYMLLHAIGRALDQHLIQSRKWRWLPYKSIETVDRLFDRWGPIIIIINRFLMGLRSAIAVFSGLARVKPGITFLCASISVLIWNAMLILSGKWLGENWQAVLHVLQQYQRVLIIVIAVVVVAILGRAAVMKFKTSRP